MMMMTMLQYYSCFFVVVVSTSIVSILVFPISWSSCPLCSFQPLIHFMGSDDDALQEYSAGCVRNIARLAQANRDTLLYVWPPPLLFECAAYFIVLGCFLWLLSLYLWVYHRRCSHFEINTPLPSSHYRSIIEKFMAHVMLESLISLSQFFSRVAAMSHMLPLIYSLHSLIKKNKIFYKNRDTDPQNLPLCGLDVRESHVHNTYGGKRKKISSPTLPNLLRSVPSSADWLPPLSKYSYWQISVTVGLVVNVFQPVEPIKTFQIKLSIRLWRLCIYSSQSQHWHHITPMRDSNTHMLGSTSSRSKTDSKKELLPVFSFLFVSLSLSRSLSWSCLNLRWTPDLLCRSLYVPGCSLPRPAFLR